MSQIKDKVTVSKSHRRLSNGVINENGGVISVNKAKNLASLLKPGKANIQYLMEQVNSSIF
ncbi:MAG: hypothetical protein ACRY3E_05350 [Candidatus Lariskella arthropodorum]